MKKEETKEKKKKRIREAIVVIALLFALLFCVQAYARPNETVYVNRSGDYQIQIYYNGEHVSDYTISSSIGDERGMADGSSWCPTTVTLTWGSDYIELNSTTNTERDGIGSYDGSDGWYIWTRQYVLHYYFKTKNVPSGYGYKGVSLVRGDQVWGYSTGETTFEICTDTNDIGMTFNAGVKPHAIFRVDIGPQTYNINFNPNGGTIDGNSYPSGVGTTITYDTNDVYQGTYNNGGQAPVWASSSRTCKTGYTLDGWYDGAGTKVFNADCSKNLEASGYWNSYGQWKKAGDVNLYAHWNPNTYKCYFNANGGSLADGATNPLTFTYDSNGYCLGCAPYATRRGYNFIGWYGTTDGGDKVFDTSGHWYNVGTGVAEWWGWQPDGNWYNGLRTAKWICASDATVYAHWTQKTYTLYINPNGGTYSDTTGESTKTLKFDSNDNVYIGTPSRTGYIFKGWYTSASGGEAIWDVNGYAIQYQRHTTYWKNGYDWNGSWMGGSLRDWDHMIWNYDGNIRVYAHWEPITYKVRFNGNGNWNTSQGSYTQQVTYDLPATLTPNKFTRPDNTTYNSINYIKGYEFIGWGTSATQKTATYTDKQEVKNLKNTQGAVLDLYAIWKKPITLTFNFNGGKFNDSTTNQVLNYTMYNSELSHTFDIKQYYGGFKNNRISANKGINNKLTKTDTNGIQYRFLGYSLNPNATVPDSNFDVYNIKERTENYTIRDNTTLYAVWEPVLQMTVQLSAPQNSGVMQLTSDVPVTTTLGNFKISSGTKSTEIPSSATASVNSATIGTNVTNKDLVTYTVSAQGDSNIKFSTAADSRILDIYTHGNNNTWFDKLNTTDKFEYTIDNFSNTTSSFTIPQYIGTKKSYKTSNPESATGTSVYAIKFTCTQPSYYYSKYWNSPESTSVYGILFLNPTLPDDNTNGGIILPPYAVEDGAYEFETILN